MVDNSNGNNVRRKSTLHCRMPNCPTNQLPNPKSVAVFGLPLDISMREKWIRLILAHDPNPKFNAGFKLCYLHFDPSDIIKLGNKVYTNQMGLKVYDLKVGAIPKYFQPFADPFETKPLTLEMHSEQQPTSTMVPDKPLMSTATKRLQVGDRIVKIIVANSKPTLTPTPARTRTMVTQNYLRPQHNQQQQQQQQQQKLFCVKCIHTDVEVQRLKMKIIDLENKMKVQRLEINSWKTRFNHLNKNLQSTPRTEKCSLCNVEKLTMKESHAHLCTTANSNEDTDTDIQCDYCTKSFQTTVKLLAHLDVFHDDKTFVDCDRCESNFPMMKLLEIHRLTHKEEEPQFPCDQCDEKFYLLPRLNQHRSTKHADPEHNPIFKPFQCGSCGACFSLAKKLQAHMTSAHTVQAKAEIAKRPGEKYPFECYVCKEPMISLAEVRMHLPEHDVTPSKKCVICREPLTDDQLRFHLCRSGDKIISCEYCPQTFVSISSVMAHLENDHRDQRIHKCLDCKKYFSMKILMEYHNKLHAKKGKREHICPTCNKGFFESSHLRRHIRNAHLLERTELCDECGKAFKTIRNLEIHKLSHTVPKIQCPQCPARFHLEAALRRHQDLHRTMKYVCTICGRELKSYCGLNDHIRLHKRTDADRKYSCSLCSRKFFEPNVLKKHLETVHTTIKPFKCEHCDKAYKHSGDLNKHLRTHLGDDMYQCPKCERRYRTPYDLQKHSSKHYVEEKEAQRQKSKQMDCTE